MMGTRRGRLSRLLALLVLVPVVGCAAGGSRPSASAFDPDTVPDAFRWPSAALMWPGATRSFLIEPSGDLYNGAWVVRVAADLDGQPIPPPRTIAYEDRWCPVAHWTRRQQGVDWEFEAVARPLLEPPGRALGRLATGWLDTWSAGADRRKQLEALKAWRPGQVDSLIVGAPRKLERLPGESVGLYVSEEIRVTNRGAVRHRACLTVTLDVSDPLQPFFASDTIRGARFAFGWPTSTSDSALGWTDLPGGPLRRRQEWSLGPGETRVVRLRRSRWRWRKRRGK